MRSRLTVLAVVLAALCLLLPAGHANADPGDLPEPSGCSSASSRLPAMTTRRPVIYVHGWTDSAQASAPAAEALAVELGDDYAVYSFDYAAMSTTWPVENKTPDCLAHYILLADQAFRAGGGAGGVLAAGHSMGGIALRAAADVLTSTGNGDALMGIVTVATPHRGSPLGGTRTAEFFQTYKTLASIWGGSDRAVLSGTSAAHCLAEDSDCPRPPYLSGDQQIAMLGSQITIERQLFAMRYLLKNPKVRVFGDGIVPLTSAIGYIDSGDGPGPMAQLRGSETLECVESDSQLRHSLADVLTGPHLSEALNAAIDIDVANSYLEGTYKPKQLGTIVMAMASSCSHIHVMKNPWTVRTTARYLRAVVVDASRSPEEKALDRRRWLYEVTTTAADGTGGNTKARYGDGTPEHQNSTAQALGCEADVVRHDYPLDGLYESLTATVGHRLGSNPTTQSHWEFLLDGKTLATVDLAERDTRPLQLDVSNGKLLTIRSSTVTQSGCDVKEPVGVLGEAYLMESRTAPRPSPSATTSTPGATTRYGWPTTRHDGNPAFYAWLGAASAWGVVKMGMVNWLACDSKGTCVAGTDKEVLVTVSRTSGRVVVAEFTATGSAKKKLKSLGATAKEIADLLRP